MTYFEWVDNLQTIKSSPMDYELLKKMDGKELDGNKYVYNRFIGHIINTVVDRLDAAYENLISKITFDVNLDDLALEIIKYKKELKFIDKILDLAVIENEDKMIMKTNIEKTIADIYNILESNIKYIDVDGYYISVFEKIMNSDVEE